jgi:hypothetical protein
MQHRPLAALLLFTLVISTARMAPGQCGGCPSGQSGDIKVARINQGGLGTPETIMCVPAGTDFTIDLSNWTWQADNWVIHVFDCDSAATPTHHIGRITLAGNPTNVGNLAVLVAGATASWTDLPVSSLDSGCIDFGGLGVAETGLRARTRASIAIAGDVTRVSGVNGPDPDIHVNQIVRLQVEGRTVNGDTLGGSIDGQVIADGSGTLFGSTSNAIAQLRAWRAIRGTVRAADKNIFAVRITGDHTAASPPEGISGDILADNGLIGTVYTTGPIGRTEGERLKITAGKGIRRIRAGFPSGVGEFTALAKDFDMDVVSNALVAADPDAWPYNYPQDDGALEMIQTDGDFVGTVRATNIVCMPVNGGGGLVPDPGDTPCRPGIYVKGVMYADVNVDLFVYFGNILARSILGEVRVGRFIKGAIVATGGAVPPDPLPTGWADGRINAVSIGRGGLPGNAGSSIFYGQRGPGLCGVDDQNSDGPFVPATPDDWFTAPPQDLSAIEGIVHAQASIGSVDIASVSLTFNFTSGASGCKALAPRIEAPVIGSLVIDDFATGSVWSGAWTPGVPMSGCAEIGSISIGCMREKASLWMRDWDEAIVGGNMFGNIIVPEVPPGRSIVIGGILGDESNPIYTGDFATAPCECQIWNPNECDQCALFDIINEASPRDPDYPRCGGVEDDRGQVWVLAADGLQGQIVINAAAAASPASVLVTGAVVVGETDGCADLDLAASRSQPDTLPWYQRVSADLGGGSVGLVPFALHREDCEPAADASQAARTFLNSAFCHIPYFANACLDTPAGDPYVGETITLDFYGPIERESGTVNPYVIGVWSGTLGDFDFSVDYGQWTACEIVPPPSGAAARRLVIRGVDFPAFIEGRYAIRPRREGNARLLCADLLPGAVATAVGEFQYEFWLDGDCNTNGVADRDESPSFCCAAWPCDPDYNADGTPDQDDVAYLNNVIAGGANPTQRDPDFNRDGNVDQEDLAALTNTVAGGGCP